MICRSSLGSPCVHEAISFSDWCLLEEDHLPVKERQTYATWVVCWSDKDTTFSLDFVAFSNTHIHTEKTVTHIYLWTSSRTWNSLRRELSHCSIERWASVKVISRLPHCATVCLSRPIVSQLIAIFSHSIYTHPNNALRRRCKWWFAMQVTCFQVDRMVMFCLAHSCSREIIAKPWCSQYSKSVIFETFWNVRRSSLTYLWLDLTRETT